ncbi:MAG: M3 family metallopeptidase [Helicobacteraceae bacterium]|jgi:oligopeptidase A|nr:M3 family metallopeptidase [Helicobacteraceae bacterium]
MFDEFDIGELAAKPAELEELLARNRAAIENLIAMPNKTFTNFARALAELDEKIARFMTPLTIAQCAENSPETQAAYEAVLPLLSEYETNLAQNLRLFSAYKEILAGDLTLTNAQKRTLEYAILDFELEGAALGDIEKSRIKEINSRLAEIDNAFSQNLLDATKNYSRSVDRSDLAGVMASDLSAFEDENGGYKLFLLPHAFISFMSYGENRELREALYRAHCTRAPENEAIAAEMLSLKDEKSKLVGFAHYADYSTKTKMAGNAKSAIDFVQKLIEGALPQARREIAELREFARSQGFEGELAAYDFAFWSKKQEIAKYQIDEDEYKNYFETFNVLAGLFEFLKQLFGAEFRETAAKTWNENARAYDLLIAGEVKARLYVDLFERKTKRGGAWMDNWQTRFVAVDGAVNLPSAYICCNFPSPTANAPSLLRHDDVVTLFHEMGHAIHHLFSRVDERDASGVNGVEWDAVEFPSQWLENFAYEPKVLRLFARHRTSGEAITDEMILRLNAAKNYNSALAMLRQCEFSLFDLLIHQAPLSAAEIQAALDRARETTALIRPPAYNKFQNGFSHIFGGGYSAGYYSYKWAEVLSADAYFAFADRGVFDDGLAARFMTAVLSAGGSRSSAENFRDFLGRDPNPSALLRLCGIES